MVNYELRGLACRVSVECQSYSEEFSTVWIQMTVLITIVIKTKHHRNGI